MKEARALVERLLGYQLRTGYDVQTGVDTNAPSVVWADADYEVGDGTCGLHETQKPANEPAIPYVRFDALTAALDENERLRVAAGQAIDFIHADLPFEARDALRAALKGES